MRDVLVSRAYDVCSSEYYLSCGLQHLKKVLDEQNDYPNWVINKSFKEFQSKQHETTPIATDNEEWSNKVKNHLLILPCRDLLILPCSSQWYKNGSFLYRQEPSTCFNVKDKTLFKHEHDTLYYAKYPEESCLNDYVNESVRRVLEWVLEWVVLESVREC